MKIFKKIGIFLATIGMYPLRLAMAIAGTPIYFINLSKLLRRSRDGWSISIFPMLPDRFEKSGVASGHYFHMDLWASRLIFNSKIIKIVDVGSRVDGFIAHILTFREIEVLDVRPLVSTTRGLSFRKIDMTNPDASPLDYADCVTCLHTLEHFGLGRYGDEVNISGWKVGLNNLTRMVARNGNLLIAVPVGRERIEFDAHRVFRPETLISAVTALGFKLNSFSAVDDDGNFHETIDPTDCNNLEYGCGCFHFIKN